MQRADPMSEPRDQLLREALALSDEAILEASPALAPTLVEAVAKHPFVGLALRAPLRAPTTGLQTLPILLVEAQEPRRAAMLPDAENLTVVAVPLGRGPALATPLLATPKSGRRPVEQPRERPEPPPEDPNVTSRQIEVKALDANQELRLPWHAGRVAITIVQFDQTTNTAVVELVPPDSATPADAAASRAKAIHTVADAAALHQSVKATLEAKGFPRFGLTDRTPKLDKPGVKLAMPETAKLDEPTLPAFGALRLAVTAQMLVSCASAPELPRAIVNAVAVLVQENVRRPRTLAFELPIVAKEALKAGDVVDLGFELDLAPLLVGALPGRSAVYLFAADVLDGPHALQLVRG